MRFERERLDSRDDEVLPGQSRAERDWRVSRDWQQYFGGPPRHIADIDDGGRSARRGPEGDRSWGEGRGGPGPGGFSQGSQHGWSEGGYPRGMGGQWAAGPFVGRGPRNYRRSDDRIREDVCERLQDDDRIDGRGLEVRVSDCVVILTGAAESREAKRLAEDVASEVPGVKDVDNRLRVAG
jgi:hypothetical protein